MNVLTSALGGVVGRIFSDRSYWSVELSNGKILQECDQRYDPACTLMSSMEDQRNPSISRRRDQMRPFDWTLDLIDTSDILKVRKLSLLCPPNLHHPLGQKATLTITEPGTAFQLKIGHLTGFGEMTRSIAAQVIGKVTNKETGDCECFLWDAALHDKSNEIGSGLATGMGHWHSNVYHFGAWREGIAAFGALNFEVIGLRL